MNSNPMNRGRSLSQFSAGGSQFSSKFVVTYSKLFLGMPPKQISPQLEHDRFFSDLLDLKVDKPYLESELDKLSKDSCLGKLKPFLSTLFQVCIKYTHTAKYEDVKKKNALETQSILLSRVLAKNLTGWEVMEILAGSVARSDAVFSDFTEILDNIMGDAEAPASIRHQALQVSLAYMCGVGQLSTGAYFLRRDFFPSIVALVKTPEMEEYTFEAILFLAILANYHKSEAAKLNPYIKRIRESTDGEFMRKLCWASNFAFSSSIKAYQDISDDSIPATFVSSIGSIITRLRPDRALAFSAPSSPRDLFKDQPLEATVVLLPVYEFLLPNTVFPTVLMEDLVSPPDHPELTQLTPLPCTIISLASYLCTHASSTASPRSIAYARLSLNILLAMVENNMVVSFATQTNVPVIRLCRQRPPDLPLPTRQSQPLICSILDCCALWLRHNLQKQLDVSCYTNCVWICYRAIWFLQSNRIRLNYDWTDLWASVIGLLGFLSSKLDILHTTGGVELLASETIRLLDLALCTSEAYLPSARALHEFIYELVRSCSVLKKQEALFKSLALPYSSDARSTAEKCAVQAALTHIVEVAGFYEEKVTQSGTGISGNAKTVMKVIAAEIEADGVHVTREFSETTVPVRSQDVLDFARFACADVVALLP